MVGYHVATRAQVLGLLAAGLPGKVVEEHTGIGTATQYRWWDKAVARGFDPEERPLLILDEYEKKQDTTKRGSGFVGDNLDRRVVAQWAGENPGSRLANAVLDSELLSRYGAPIILTAAEVPLPSPGWDD
ncbi:hypothetical protein VMCG_02343 [Cytospora schulzeri]|uniref:Uncharacterized protein n=1 Tax=Cytospora schulzeri TaxID=448051 RepID=A0A423X1T7_9PEZI|nr:hypothetical protein VMCG_02343 [Valsa malicola]